MAEVQPKQSKVTHKLGTTDLETQLFQDIEETLVLILFNDGISIFHLEVEMHVLQQLKYQNNFLFFSSWNSLYFFQ